MPLRSPIKPFDLTGDYADAQSTDEVLEDLYRWAGLATPAINSRGTGVVGADNGQSDWDEIDLDVDGFILNKPLHCNHADLPVVGVAATAPATPTGWLLGPTPAAVGTFPLQWLAVVSPHVPLAAW